MNKATIFLALLILAASVYAKPLLLIIDASDSMTESLPSGKTKIDTAKEVAIQTVNTYNDQIALMVYTDCDSGGDPLSGNIRVLEAFTTDKYKLTAAIQGIQTDSSTPIANAVKEGVTYISQSNPGAQMLLLTDGEETCGGDVTGAIQSAEQSGVNVKVVGFALSNSSQNAISTAVTSGGGKYYNAGDETELQQAFNQAVGNDSGGSCCMGTALLAIPFFASLYLARKAAA